MSVRECVDRCYGQVTTRPDRSPNAIYLDAVVEAANRMVSETEGLDKWMRETGFDPDEVTDLLLVARLLVAERMPEYQPANA